MRRVSQERVKYLNGKEHLESTSPRNTTQDNQVINPHPSNIVLLSDSESDENEFEPKRNLRRATTMEQIKYMEYAMYDT